LAAQIEYILLLCTTHIHAAVLIKCIALPRYSPFRSATIDASRRRRRSGTNPARRWNVAVVQRREKEEEV